MLIDRVGRRIMMVGGAFGMTICLSILPVLASSLSMNSNRLGVPNLALSIPRSVILYIATGFFGIGWLSRCGLSRQRYIRWHHALKALPFLSWYGLLQIFAVTLLTPIGFNNLKTLAFPCFRRYRSLRRTVDLGVYFCSRSYFRSVPSRCHLISDNCWLIPLFRHISPKTSILRRCEGTWHLAYAEGQPGWIPAPATRDEGRWLGNGNLWSQVSKSTSYDMQDLYGHDLPRRESTAHHSLTYDQMGDHNLSGWFFALYALRWQRQRVQTPQILTAWYVSPLDKYLI
jgi:hypothetical protein